jgi:hypothetical protein
MRRHLQLLAFQPYLWVKSDLAYSMYFVEKNVTPGASNMSEMSTNYIFSFLYICSGTAWHITSKDLQCIVRQLFESSQCKLKSFSELEAVYLRLFYDYKK